MLQCGGTSASLISYKYVARQAKGLRGRYLAVFTGTNLAFLFVLLLLHDLLA